MKQIPILFISDSPCSFSGLARITKDLALHACSLPEFRVGTLGKWGRGSSKLPFMQYNFENGWSEEIIEDVWSDFSRGAVGVIFTIWDASRLGWFSNPMMGGKLETFLRSGRFQRWGYFPIDSYGPHGRLTMQMRDTIAGYDRVLAYTIYGSQVLQQTLGHEVEWIPHGYNDKVFQPRERTAGRSIINVSDTDVLIGMVGTNQSRKDWGVAFEAVSLLCQNIPSLKFWVHTDHINRYWDIQALIYDFGLADVARVTFTGQMTSETLSYMYSACNMTFLVSHEGMGYPLIESMACGVPVVHGMCGGGEELIPDRNWLVKPASMRLDTQFNIYRPVFSPESWAEKIQYVLAQAESGALKDVSVNATSHLIWRNLWPSVWKKWFLKGISQ